MDRRIVHVDLPRFVSSIETAIEPTLKTKAFAVVPTVSPRAPVVDVSLEAWRDGARKGMKLYEAKKLVPRLRAVRPHWEAVHSAGERLFEIAHGLSPFVERAGNGHFFADLTGDARAADRLLSEVRSLRTFNCVVGVATNKLVSKVADRAFKLWQPCGDGILRVEPEEEEGFLGPLPVTLLPELHPKTSDLFDLLNIRFMRDLAGLDPAQARAVFGKKGPLLVREARGIDDSPVRPYIEEGNVVEERILFSPDTNDWGFIRARLFAAVERLEGALRERRSTARRLSVEVTYTDLETARRHRAIGPAKDAVHDLFAEAMAALEAACTRRVRVKSLAVEVSGLVPATLGPHDDSARRPRSGAKGRSRQIGLFRDKREERRERLAGAVRAVRSRFGVEAIRYGASLT